MKRDRCIFPTKYIKRLKFLRFLNPELRLKVGMPIKLIQLIKLGGMIVQWYKIHFYLKIKNFMLDNTKINCTSINHR
jgi:hypothetical protein